MASTLQQQTPSNVSLRDHEEPNDLTMVTLMKTLLKKGFVSFETISPLHIVRSHPVT